MIDSKSKKCLCKLWSKMNIKFPRRNKQAEKKPDGATELALSYMYHAEKQDLISRRTLNVINLTIIYQILKSGFDVADDTCCSTAV